MWSGVQMANKIMIWVTEQLHRLGLIEIDDVRAVVEGAVNEKLKREFSVAGLHNSGTRPCMVERG